MLRALVDLFLRALSYVVISSFLLGPSLALSLWDHISFILGPAVSLSSLGRALIALAVGQADLTLP